MGILGKSFACKEIVRVKKVYLHYVTWEDDYTSVLYDSLPEEQRRWLVSW